MQRITCPILVMTLLAVSARAEEVVGLRVPDGFEVVEYAGSALANDIYTLTTDARGRVVVAGRGYIRTLIDDDGDGKADRVVDFADSPRDGAMGLLWEGDQLLVIGDGGLRRFFDRDRDGKADGPSELILPLKTGGEHDAHALRRGPDGWLYILCGNSTGINSRHANQTTSPIRSPVAGCVIRLSPDFGRSEIVADGFRNPYGMDFNLEGDLFTYDSDNERCVALPWYEPTRFYHVIEGAQHGWRTPQIGQFWRFPPYYPDVVAPLITLGRGSPTGIACYRHVQFPAKYRGGFFALDWTFGKVHFVGLQRRGASYAATAGVFLESVGDNGFAPTGCVVHPHTGDLFVSIGGRGTRGAVYRISYRGGKRELGPAEAAQFALPCRSLEWQPARRQELLTGAIEGQPWQRLACLQELRRRRANFQDRELEPIVLACADADDAHLRRAAARLYSTLEPASRVAVRGMAGTARVQAVLLLADAQMEPADRFNAAARLLEDKHATEEAPLAALRVMQLALGDLTARTASGTVWEGYTARQPIPSSLSAAAWRDRFPTGRAEVDRELSRLLAMMEDDSSSTVERVAAQLTPESGPEDDFHYLAVLARLRGARSPRATERTVNALLGMDKKLDARQATRDRHWPLRMAELHAELARKDPALNQRLLKDESFGRPDHIVLTYAPGFDRYQAARVLIQRSDSNAEFPWTPAHVELLGELSDKEVKPLARRLWSQPALRDALLPLLARAPEKADRSRFISALGSPRLATIRTALEALERVQAPDDGTACLALIRCLRSLPDGKEEKPLKERLATALRNIAQADHGTDASRWSEWFSANHPNLASQLHGTDGVDVAGWSRRLQAIDWTRGEAGRGQVVYQKTGCASCHSGGQALGPDLRGVTGRFSREDLFTAIVQPSRDVSPRYQTALIATVDGKVYQGSIIYEATDSVILQTGPTTTLRIAGNQIASKRSTPVSLMPAGLLDQATDQDIADLFAYLRTLRGP